MFETLFGDEGDQREDGRAAVNYTISLSDLIQMAAALGVMPLTDRDVTASEVINWRCSETHEFEASWRQQRRRRCPLCPALSYGEKLARALLEIYFPAGGWRKVRDKGFDPDNPGLRLEIDLVSDAYEITVECQSSLHVQSDPKQGFATKIPIEEMIRRDKIKRNLGSSHPRFANYKHVELWFELSDVKELVSKAVTGKLDPVKAIVDRFEQSLAEGGVMLPIRPLPLLDDLFSGFSEALRTREIVEEHGLFLLPSPWLGVSALPVRCGKCAHEWTSSLSQLRRGWSRGRTGCAKCWGIVFEELSTDRSDSGWDAFRELCGEHGFLLFGPTSGSGTIPVTVREISTGKEFEGRRHYIAERLLDGLPIIDAKRIEYEKRRSRVATTIARHRATLRAYGIQLLVGQDRPTTERDRFGNIHTNKFEVRYLACKHKGKVFLGPFIGKLAKQKSREADGMPGFCPRCRRAEIALEKTNWMIALAEKHCVTFLGPDYIDATRTKYGFSCRPGCVAKPYKAVFSNLEKNGIACRGCKKIGKRERQSLINR